MRFNQPSPELIQETIRVFQPYFDKPISEDDAVDAIYRMQGLFEVLARTIEPSEVEAYKNRPQ